MNTVSDYNDILTQFYNDGEITLRAHGPYEGGGSKTFEYTSRDVVSYEEKEIAILLTTILDHYKYVNLEAGDRGYTFNGRIPHMKTFG